MSLGGVNGSIPHISGIGDFRDCNCYVEPAEELGREAGSTSGDSLEEGNPPRCLGYGVVNMTVPTEFLVKVDSQELVCGGGLYNSLTEYERRALDVLHS